ncbi:hypothetical protein CJD38_02225 [Stenotrophobium rhamnosiphilum]|uniref:DUF1161 domain-containing protein n=1 Tax=Stenotrophobium rhamnosiphilum TaxID=2029166 RepID=A0A2T5MK57_9GAMM|nr:DUF1161 domain-containing protein [Stenotrophobium rhamnosiphilum]PTU32950.1 hypothetical protein CJD38_02225 [Stenotrophobium rhamnosiphilum]
MKKVILMAGLFAAVAAMPVFAGTPCDEVKAQIAKKLDGKGVKGYTLEAVAAADVKGQKVVGSCEAGSKQIVYTRGAAKAANAETKAATKAAAPAKAEHHAAPAAKAAAAPAAPAPAMKGPVMTKPGAAKQ